MISTICPTLYVCVTLIIFSPIWWLYRLYIYLLLGAEIWWRAHKKFNLINHVLAIVPNQCTLWITILWCLLKTWPSPLAKNYINHVFKGYMKYISCNCSVYSTQHNRRKVSILIAKNIGRIINCEQDNKRKTRLLGLIKIQYTK